MERQCNLGFIVFQPFIYLFKSDLFALDCKRCLLNYSMSFSNVDQYFRLSKIFSAGNSVRIGDGCATVLGYKLYYTTESSKGMVREGWSKVRSPKVRIPAGDCSLKLASHEVSLLLRKEKDEASSSSNC